MNAAVRKSEATGNTLKYLVMRSIAFPFSCSKSSRGVPVDGVTLPLFTVHLIPCDVHAREIVYPARTRVPQTPCQAPSTRFAERGGQTDSKVTSTRRQCVRPQRSVTP